MYGMDTETTETFGLCISRQDGDVASRLTQRNDKTGDTEEATVALQGIVCKINLPPFEARTSRPDDLKRLAHVRQSITLTGLGSKRFEQTVENSRRAYSMFSRYTPNARLIPTPEFLGKQQIECDTNGDQHLTISASNRFFTPAKQCASLETVNVNAELDPRGTLAKVDQSKYLHTEDNSIDYYILTDSDGEKRQVPTSENLQELTPIGDIVEIMVSMMCIPSKGNFTVKLILQSVTLLDGNLTTDATTARTLIDGAIPVQPKRLKQRNPYTSDLKTHKSKAALHARIDMNEGAEEHDGGEGMLEDVTIRDSDQQAWPELN
ncbi:hypothetical protein BDN71DRAFT_1497277 [Pleurotus eryngii]|uniref:Uncharacterized protein n=1 Tax=Pleurotus eryngii TaxID=5323 RepID=A0A9P6DDI2_PLEER|nr:hypothetical protein BDN71DRAFT_1497277 [Pleurotus eryngii]